MVCQVSFLPFDVKKEDLERNGSLLYHEKKKNLLIFWASIFLSNIQVLLKTAFFLIFYAINLAQKNKLETVQWKKPRK